MAEKVAHSEVVEDRDQENRNDSLKVCPYVHIAWTATDLMKNIDVAEIKTVKGSEAFHEAKIQEAPSLLHPRSILLFLCIFVGFLCQTMNGFDGSLFNGLTANSKYLDDFHGSASGPWPALMSAMYQIGTVVALPFVGPCIDTWGRRQGMFIGSFIIVLGTLVTGLTMDNHSAPQFRGGRFLLGFGVAIASAAGPIYVVEVAHPAHRAIATAYANCTWFVGSILAAGSVRGALNLGGTLSWQIPVWLQLVFAGLVCIFAFFIPESPRWLYVHGKKDKAREVLAKWHGHGNAESPWVKLQLGEYEEYLNVEGSDKRWWDYRALFRNQSSRYRLACNCVFSIFAQWAGNGVLSYFLPAVLETAGYKADVTKANINLGYACFQFCFALLGAAFVDKVGRRPLMLGSMGSVTVVWIGMTIASAKFSQSGQEDGNAAKATLAMIFLFGAFYSVGITPLQALYPVEVLSFEMRAKGMAFSSLSVAIGGLLNQFAVSRGTCV